MATYRVASERIWRELFFGTRGGAAGAILKHVAALPPDDRNAFVGAFASPRLSAALVLWAAPLLQAGDADSLWFRLSVAQLQRQAPWLFASAPPEVIQGELVENVSAVNEAWRQIVRAGAALQCLADLMGPTPASGPAKSAKVTAGQVLWQANGLAYATKPCERHARAKAEVRMLGEDAVRKFRGDRLKPLDELLADCGAELPAGVAGVLSEIAADCAAVVGYAP